MEDGGGCARRWVQGSSVSRRRRIPPPPFPRCFFPLSLLRVSRSACVCLSFGSFNTILFPHACACIVPPVLENICIFHDVFIFFFFRQRFVVGPKQNETRASEAAALPPCPSKGLKRDRVRVPSTYGIACMRSSRNLFTPFLLLLLLLLLYVQCCR